MPLEFSAASKTQVERILGRYPTKQAALLPVLHVAQDEFGHLPDEALDLVARTLDLPPSHVYGVITFYTMFHRARRGGNQLMVCTNVACMLRGGYEVMRHIERRLGVKAGETTPDGAFTLIEEECLAACANAPMMVCGSEYFLDLTTQKVDAILDDLRKRHEERKRMARAAGAPPSSQPALGAGPATGRAPGTAGPKE